VEDLKDCRSYHPFDSHKTTSLGGDFLEEGDSPEEEEDSPEAEDTQAEEEHHLEDHQEAVGDHHQCPCLKLLKGN